MRRVRLLGVALAFMGWALALPVWADDSFLRYEGTYLEITFAAGKRVTRPMKLQLYEPSGVGVRAGSGEAALRLTDGGVTTQWHVVSRFVGTTSAAYLGVHGNQSVALHLAGLPDARTPGGTPLSGQLLFSSGGDPRPVQGTWHVPRARPGRVRQATGGRGARRPRLRSPHRGARRTPHLAPCTQGRGVVRRDAGSSRSCGCVEARPSSSPWKRMR